ncbi:MAG: hypothetical protein U0441_37350 [Polyangiaceae bacterium]
MTQLHLSRTLAWTLALAATSLLPACGVDETVNSVDTGTTATETTTTTDTSGTGGTGGSPEKVIRTVEQRNPFGDVAETKNLLWDGDFEWTSPFSDQYGWLFGPPYSFAFPSATIGAACLSGVKCASIPKNKSILGIGVTSSVADIEVVAHAKPKTGVCKDVDVALLDPDNSQKDAEVPAATEAPGADGWCLYTAKITLYGKKVYLLIDNNTGDELLTDDEVVRPEPAGAPPPPPPPMGPARAEVVFRRDAARAAIDLFKRPVDPPKSPARRAFEEHLGR